MFCLLVYSVLVYKYTCLHANKIIWQHACQMACITYMHLYAFILVYASYSVNKAHIRDAFSSV